MIETFFYFESAPVSPPLLSRQLGRFPSDGIFSHFRVHPLNADWRAHSFALSIWNLYFLSTESHFLSWVALKYWSWCQRFTPAHWSVLILQTLGPQTEQDDIKEKLKQNVSVPFRWDITVNQLVSDSKRHKFKMFSKVYNRDVYRLLWF